MHPVESGVVEDDRDDRDRTKAVEAGLVAHRRRRGSRCVGRQRVGDANELRNRRADRARGGPACQSLIRDILAAIGGIDWHSPIEAPCHNQAQRDRAEHGTGNVRAPNSHPVEHRPGDRWTQHTTEPVGRLLKTQRFAAPLGRGMSSDQRGDRRRRTALADREQQQGDDQHRPHLGDGIAARPATSNPRPTANSRSVPNVRPTARTRHPTTNTNPTPRKTAAEDASVNPKRRSPNSENVASNAVKATTVMNPMIARWRRIGDVGPVRPRLRARSRRGESRAGGSSRQPR